MTEKMQIYKCMVCGNIVMVMHAGKGELVCCGQPMKLMVENTVEASYEKHIPVIEKTAKGFVVKVGSVPHPMEEKHYIEWVEATSKDVVLLKFLKPGEKPEAEFDLPAVPDKAREYCNIHGLWTSKK